MTSIDPVNAVQLGTLMKVVAAMHAVPNDRIPALKGRFRNFLKLGFPDVLSVGTGNRAEYWPGHVAQVLVAFELVGFRIPQTAAADCIANCANVIETAVGEAARRITGQEPNGIRKLLVVSSNALLEDAKKPGFRDISISVTSRLEEVFARRATVLAIDAGYMVARAARAARVTDEPFTENFFTTLGRA